MLLGSLSLVSFLTLVGVWVARWRRGERAAIVLPWLLLGMYAIGTGGLAAVGRAWASQSGENALTPRYVIHAIPLVIALVVLAAIELERRRRRGAPSATRAATAGTALLTTSAARLSGRTQGRLMMGVWESARLRAATSALFYELHETVTIDDWVPRSKGFARRINRLGLLDPPMLPDDRLKNFRIEPKPASSSIAGWDVLWKIEERTLRAEGYARLPGHTRVADGIFFTRRSSGREDHIFHVAHVSRLPLYLGQAIGRDLRFVHHQGDPLEMRDLSGFETEFQIAEPAVGPVFLAAWMFNYRTRSVTLIDRFVYQSGTGRIEGVRKHVQKARSSRQKAPRSVAETAPCGARSGVPRQRGAAKNGKLTICVLILDGRPPPSRSFRLGPRGGLCHGRARRGSLAWLGRSDAPPRSAQTPRAGEGIETGTLDGNRFSAGSDRQHHRGDPGGHHRRMVGKEDPPRERRKIGSRMTAPGSAALRTSLFGRRR